MGRNPNEIGNSATRSLQRQKHRHEKRVAQTELRKKRQREREELGEDSPPKQVPRTIDSTAKKNEAVVEPNDEEVLLDEEEDEFSDYFNRRQVPKLMITTRPRPKKELYGFVGDLMLMFPNAFFYKRKEYDLKDIKVWAAKRGFTHLMVLGQSGKECNRLLLIHLPEGPSALFKISSVVHPKEIRGHGTKSDHLPEIILNRFQTRIGHRVGRFLGSLFNHNPEFPGRNVVTFHNQRDFIFARQHRYKFNEDGSGARLQEIGPRFTMKLKWLMKDAFATQHGEYEWVAKRKLHDTSRRDFSL